MNVVKETSIEVGQDRYKITLKIDELGTEHLYFSGEKIDFNTLVDRVGTFDAYNAMSALTE